MAKQRRCAVPAAVMHAPQLNRQMKAQAMPPELLQASSPVKTAG
jgi:hypothetical protein